MVGWWVSMPAGGDAACLPTFISIMYSVTALRGLRGSLGPAPTDARPPSSSSAALFLLLLLFSPSVLARPPAAGATAEGARGGSSTA